MATSEVAICNLALQKLGAGSITSLSDNSTEARACAACYEAMRDRELRAYPWNFAKKRATLAPDATAPAFDFTYAFTPPTDFLRLLPATARNNFYGDQARNDSDWRIESGKILTNDGDTLEIVYVARVTDPTKFDVLFVEALACKMAWHMCERITQSNQKKADLLAEYRAVIAEARRVNAFENVPIDAPMDTWLSARL
jgi:hypothetical protein